MLPHTSALTAPLHPPTTPLQACEQRLAALRRDNEELQERHAELRRRFRLLYNGYRSLRYKVADDWPQGSEPLRVPHEEAVIDRSYDDITRLDEEGEARQLVRLRDKVCAAGGAAGVLRVCVLVVC